MAQTPILSSIMEKVSVYKQTPSLIAHSAPRTTSSPRSCLL